METDTKPRQVADINAFNLESLVVIAGPRSSLPDQHRHQPILTGLIYRPTVEVRDGAERIYSKYNLPLFEILNQEGTLEHPEASGGENEEEEVSKIGDGPASAVLRRRRSTRQIKPTLAASQQQQQQQKASAKNATPDEPEEDLSDAHYKKMHRKPEYVEKRIRTRELELYEYARWQAGQQLESARSRTLNHLPVHLTSNEGSEMNGSMGSQSHSRCASPNPHISKSMEGETTAAHGTAATCNSDSPAPAQKDKHNGIDDASSMISDTLKQLDSIQQESPAGAVGRKRRSKYGMRKELAALLDSNGYQEARSRSLRGTPSIATPSTRSGSPEIPSNGQVPNNAAQASTLQQTCNTSSSNAGAADALDPEFSHSSQLFLSEKDRQMAHSTGEILEQFLIQASRLPPAPLTSASSAAAARTPVRSDNEDDIAADADTKSSGYESDADANTSCCCPQEFSLPRRLYGQMIKQREH